MSRTSRTQWALASISAGALATACVQGEDQSTAEELSGAFTTTVVNYESFSDAGGYDLRWFDLGTHLSVGDPTLVSGRSFPGGALNLATPAFTTAHDFSYDHMKYFAASTQAFDIPTHGAVMVSADIHALTPGAAPGRINPVTGRRLKEGQQAAATLSMIDADNTGLHLAWWVSERKAFALYERITTDGRCDTSKTFTQIIGEVALTPGTHNFAIEYRRTGNSGNDRVRWLVDGRERNHIGRAGIPHDVTNPHVRSAITYPSQGPGEELRDQLSAFLVGHGVGTMVDEYPFNQCPTGQVSIPASERVFGQGIDASFDNIAVSTTRRVN